MPEALWVGGSTSTVVHDDPDRRGSSGQWPHPHLDEASPVGSSGQWSGSARRGRNVVAASPAGRRPRRVPRRRAASRASSAGDPRRDLTVVDVDRVVCLDGVPFWELRTRRSGPHGAGAAGLASHLESVRLPTPDEVEAPAAPGSGGLWLATVGRLAVRTYLGARRAAADPRLTGVLRAGPSVAFVHRPQPGPQCGSGARRHRRPRPGHTGIRPPGVPRRSARGGPSASRVAAQRE